MSSRPAQATEWKLSQKTKQTCGRKCGNFASNLVQIVTLQGKGL